MTIFPKCPNCGSHYVSYIVDNDHKWWGCSACNRSMSVKLDDDGNEIGKPKTGMDFGTLHEMEKE